METWDLRRVTKLHHKLNHYKTLADATVQSAHGGFFRQGIRLMKRDDEALDAYITGRLLNESRPQQAKAEPVKDFNIETYVFDDTPPTHLSTKDRRLTILDPLDGMTIRRPRRERTTEPRMHRTRESGGDPLQPLPRLYTVYACFLHTLHSILRGTRGSVEHTARQLLFTLTPQIDLVHCDYLENFTKCGYAPDWNNCLSISMRDAGINIVDFRNVNLLIRNTIIEAFNERHEGTGTLPRTPRNYETLSIMAILHPDTCLFVFWLYDGSRSVKKLDMETLMAAAYTRLKG